MATTDEIKAVQRVIGATPDGAFGPRSVDALVAWMRRYQATAVAVSEAIAPTPRARVVAIARAEVGEQDPQKYHREAAPMYVGLAPNAKAWCGVFALWCLRRAGLTSATWKDGVGFVGALGLRPPVYPALPEPGDVAYYSAGQHYAIVEHVAGGMVHTIDGNAYTAPAEGVKLRVRPVREAAAYYSIGSLIR